MCNESFPIFILKRDNKEVMRGSEIACLDYIHNNHCYSMEHACKYEGYSLEKA